MLRWALLPSRRVSNQCRIWRECGRTSSPTAPEQLPAMHPQHLFQHCGTNQAAHLPCHCHYQARLHFCWSQPCLYLFGTGSGKLTSRAPPCTFFIPIILSCNKSSNIMTASTTILEKNSLLCEISFELRAVAAHFSRRLLCSLQGRKK